MKWIPSSWQSRLYLTLCCSGLAIAGSVASPTTAQAAAIITVTKKANVSLVTPGSPIDFRITVRNESPIVATSVVVTDPVPPDCVVISASAGARLVNGICAWSLGSLQPGATAEARLQVKVSPSTLLGAITNTAQVTSPQLPQPVNSNTVRVGLTLTPMPSLSLSKSVDVAATAPGGLVTFTMSVRNNGVGVATGVVLADPLPIGCTPVALSPGGTVTDGVASWSLGHIAPGASAEVMLRARIDPGAAGSVRNVAKVSCGQQEDPWESDPCHVTVRRPKLILTKSLNVNAAWPGRLITFALAVRNSGESAATRVVVTDPLPPGCVPVALSHGGMVSEGLCSWSLGDLAVGASARVTLQVRLVEGSGAVIQNTASVRCTEVSAPGSSNTVTCPVIPPPPPSLSVIKTVSVAVTTPGSLLTFKLTVKNNGGAGGTNVTLTDSLAAGVTYVGASAGGSFSGGICTWNLGSLEPGASVQVTLQVKVDLRFLGTITNTARVHCAEAPVPVASNTVSVRIEALRLSLRKSVDLLAAAPGSVLTFTLTVKNHGPGVATNLIVTDPLQSGCVPISMSHGGSLADGVCGWRLGSLAAGASLAVTLQVQMDPRLIGTVRNQAAAACSEMAAVVLSNRVVVTVGLPGLSLLKRVDLAAAAPGSLVTFTLTLKNIGSATATEVTLADQLPVGLSPVAASAGGMISGGQCLWRLGSLAPGAAVQVTLQVRVEPGLPRSLTNIAHARCAELGQPVASNSATVHVGAL